MKQWLQQLFSENGGVSMVRLLSLICVLTASMLALLGIYSTTHNLESVALLCGTFLGAGLGAKVMQKKMEAQVAPTTFLSETSSSEAASQFDKPEGKGG